MFGKSPFVFALGASISHQVIKHVVLRRTDCHRVQRSGKFVAHVHDLGPFTYP